MDVLIEWIDGSRNVVSKNELVFRKPLRKNRLVKMKWGATWWRGKVVDFENCGKCSYMYRCLYNL